MHLLQRSFILPFRIGILNQSNSSRTPKLAFLNNTRTFFMGLTKLPKMDRVELKYKRRDKMSPTATLIYSNPSAFWIEPLFHVQNLIIITGSTFLFHILIKAYNNELEFPWEFNDWYIAKDLKEMLICTILSGFVMIISSLVCKFSVLRIYFDKAERVNKAVLAGYLPFLKKIITIKPKSLSIKMRRFPIEDFKTFEYQAGGHKLLLYEKYFKTPADLHRMMKYE